MSPLISSFPSFCNCSSHNLHVNFKLTELWTLWWCLFRFAEYIVLNGQRSHLVGLMFFWWRRATCLAVMYCARDSYSQNPHSNRFPLRSFTTTTLLAGARLLRKLRTRSILSLSMSNTLLTVTIPWHDFVSWSATINITSCWHFMIDSCNSTVITTWSISIHNNSIKVSSQQHKYQAQVSIKSEIHNIWRPLSLLFKHWKKVNINTLINNGVDTPRA